VLARLLNNVHGPLTVWGPCQGVGTVRACGRSIGDVMATFGTTDQRNVPLPLTIVVMASEESTALARMKRMCAPRPSAAAVVSGRTYVTRPPTRGRRYMGRPAQHGFQAYGRSFLTSHLE
jgi:hypothetical protein